MWYLQTSNFISQNNFFKSIFVDILTFCQDFYLWYLQNSFCNATSAPFSKSSFLVLRIAVFLYPFFFDTSFVINPKKYITHYRNMTLVNSQHVCRTSTERILFPFFIRLFISSTHYVSCEGWRWLQNTNQMRFS